MENKPDAQLAGARPTSAPTLVRRSTAGRGSGHDPWSPTRPEPHGLPALAPAPAPPRTVPALSIAFAAAVAFCAITLVIARWPSTPEGPATPAVPAASAGAARDTAGCPDLASADERGRSIAAELDGDRCPETVITDGTTLTVTTGGRAVRYAVGRPGDEVLLGDWECDGIDTPGLYRPATGQVFIFEGWARRGQALHSARPRHSGVIDGLASVASGACDRIVVTPDP